MGGLDEVVERAGSGGIVAGTAIAAGLPLAGVVLAEGLLDVVLVAVAVGAASVGAWLFRRRQVLTALPLELGAHAIREEVDGIVVVKVRARLGRGRRARDPSADVRFVGADGRSRDLPTVWTSREVTGAFTITALDADGITAGPGALRVALEVRADGRAWRAERTWAELLPGRFAAPLVLERGRWVHDRERWDQVAG